MRLLAYPDSALGKRREHVVFASHYTNGFFLRFFHPLSKKILKNIFLKKFAQGVKILAFLAISIMSFLFYNFFFLSLFLLAVIKTTSVS